MSRRQFEITPELLLRAYRAGMFPMAESRQGERLYWLDPEQRGVIPLQGFHLSRRLLRTTLSGGFQITANRAFEAVIAACAEPAGGREETWINDDIERLFGALNRMGHAHSVEVWEGAPDTGRLVGGLYGVAIGGAFFGESMFSRATDASKVALVHLVARLRMFGFTLLDAQFQTAHLAQFGCHEVPRQDYKQQLAAALERNCAWHDAPDPARIETEIRALRPPAGNSA